jgi:2-aminoethylphosphonate-pyruvate transaminase
MAEDNDMSGPVRIRLLNPGPVTLSRRVRRALQSPDLCHREPDYARLQNEVRERLTRVHDGASDYEAVLLTGSGTAAVEAMLGSLVPHDGKVLVVANGIYGERMASILELQGKAYTLVRSCWTDPINTEEARQRLARDSFTHVAVVHHETTTGRLNDLAELGEACRARGVGLLLDTVSSFGGEAIDWEGWNIEACAATANKCLHSVPGISFVLARRSIFQTRCSASRSLYLDLFRNHQEQTKGYPLFTPAVQSLYALREALAELEDQGGYLARHRHYQRLSGLVRTGLERLGIHLLLGDPAVYSAILSSFVLPAGLAFQTLFDHAKQAGFVIYAGQQALKETIFRVAVMGDLTADDMDEFVRTVAAVSAGHGTSV